jgi:hypothetical protein
MTDITPVSAIQEMTKLSRILDELSHKLRDAERAAVNAEHRYRVAKAKALLAIDEGTVAERDAKATLEVADVRLSAKLAAAELSILRRDLHVIETRIDVGRSVVGVLRAEAQVLR